MMFSTQSSDVPDGYPMRQLPEQTYVYNARLVKCIDGDTIDVELDTGFHVVRLERIRLLGVNCPERKGATRPAGDAALAFTITWCGLPAHLRGQWDLRVQTKKSDAFGRYLAYVWRVSDGQCLNDALLSSGNAVEDIR